MGLAEIAADIFVIAVVLYFLHALYRRAYPVVEVDNKPK